MSAFVRRILLLILASSLTFSLFACGTPNQPPSQTQSTTETQATQIPSTAPMPANKDIVIVIPEDPPSFNAVISITGYDVMVMKLVLLGMTGIDPDGNVYPELAAELPTLANGDVTQDTANNTMSVTWKMRKDVQWEDGTPVTADDMIFTYKAITDPNTGNWIPGIDSVTNVEKIDDYTFRVDYNSIYPSYLTQFGGESVAIWPAHYCDAPQGFSAWDCGRKPLSDGPFTLQEWVQGDHMTFVRIRIITKKANRISTRSPSRSSPMQPFANK